MPEAISTSPGSFNEFAADYDPNHIQLYDRGWKPQPEEVLSDYTAALGVHRHALAAGMGITLEELHELPDPSHPAPAAGQAEDAAARPHPANGLD